MLPALAPERGWPVSADHCFQRILLDHGVGGCWYDHVAGRPAYRHVDAAQLAAAVALGEAVAAGEADLAALNAQSLFWRGKPAPRHPASKARQRARAGSRQTPSLDG